jgi:hypothetical protein
VVIFLKKEDAMTQPDKASEFQSKSPQPDNSNRLAYALSMIFHPYIVFIPPSVIALGSEGLIWGIFVGVIVVIPIAITVLIQKRSNRYVFQREARTPLFIVGWLAVWVCLWLTVILDAPDVIRVGALVIIIWTPMQFLINTFVTKASIHASLVAIAFTGLWRLGILWHPFVFLGSVLIVISVGWARKTTRNHTTNQVILGNLTGTLATLLAFLIFQV